ncbi:hypothetical protein LAWI1_G005540 [Lachnellula willkommii]|uniref:Uncharacterized protein n=1 Tax=Lachnellula willkommii TaxID=215461 RepID=A0A559M3M2_9HELO|nr:hypothetical protein LAWI1_G005540 [Lachnellula willkommii]
MGSQWAGLLLAIFGTLLTFIPFVMFKYGHVLRNRSKLAKSQLGGDVQKEKTGLYTDGIKGMGNESWARDEFEGLKYLR